MLTSGDYSLLDNNVLIDDRTGKQIVLDRFGCGAAALGVPWVLFQCNGSNFTLYNVSTGKSKSLACGQACDQALIQDEGLLVGKRWIEFIEEPRGDCGDGEHSTCGPTTYVFKNIQTGKMRYPAPLTSSEVYDLDSPALVRSLCSPLGVPAAGSFDLLADGFGIAFERSGAFLERCHSSLHMELPAFELGPWLNSHMIFWAMPNQAGRYQGMFIPSLRRFTFTIPPVIDGETTLANDRIYVARDSGGEWAAAMPSSPPSPHSR